MFRSLRRMPFLKLLAVAKVVSLARRHYRHLDPSDRRRLAELVRRGRRMNQSERRELRRLLGKLEPRAFAFASADAFSPVRLPRRLASRSAH
jgi:hypothetical protein